MAMLVSGVIDQLGRAVLAMPLAQFAGKQTEHADAADGDAPDISGAGAIIRGIQARIGGGSGTIAGKVDGNSKAELKRLGIVPKTEPAFGDLIAKWRAENVDRVTSLAAFERDKLSEILSKGANKTVPELRAAIQDRLEVSRSKADLLARDQVLKLSAKINQHRQEAAGITQYVWTTSNDERVRPMHADLDGQTFSWDDPPVTNDAGDRNHPGEDYQCRCVPFAVLPELGEQDQPTPEEEPAAPELPAPEEAPAPEPIDPDLLPPAEPPLVARAAEMVKALRSPQKNGAAIRDILREQVQAFLPGAVSQDIALGRADRGVVTLAKRRLEKVGANAAHDFHGQVLVHPDVVERARHALERKAAGLEAHYFERDAVRTLVHEEVHGHSRCSPWSVKGIGLKLEEVGTELNARRITGDVFGARVDVGSYQHWIDEVTGAVRVAMRASGSPVLIEEAEKLIADAHVKGACSGGPLFTSPEEALRAFIGALDVTEEQRAAILREIRNLPNGQP